MVSANTHVRRGLLDARDSSVALPASLDACNGTLGGLGGAVDSLGAALRAAEDGCGLVVTYGNALADKLHGAHGTRRQPPPP
eukprot:1517913-Prymnesium_polylepis.1